MLPDASTAASRSQATRTRGWPFVIRPRRIVLLACALCIAGVAMAQSAVVPPLPAAPTAAASTAPASSTASPASPDELTLVTPGTAPVPLLWKVSDADNAVYLLGSFHMLKPDDYPLSNDVNVAFADVSSVVFEMPPDEMASPQLGVQMAQAALRTDGTTLDSQLPPATRAKLAAWQAANAARLQASGLTPQALQGFEPWFVGLLVTITEMSGKGLQPALGLDRHFMDAAASAGKRTGGLESGAQQIAFLDGMSAKEQVQMLDEAVSIPAPVAAPAAMAAPTTADAPAGSAAVPAPVASPSTSTAAPSDAPAIAPPPSVESLHASWRAGDADGLWNGMGQQLRLSYPDLYRRINVERNDAWLPKVESMLSASGTDDTLVVVGALHLLGSDGLVDKLRARGYAVERICSACAVPAVPGVPDQTPPQTPASTPTPVLPPAVPVPPAASPSPGAAPTPRLR